MTDGKIPVKWLWATILTTVVSFSPFICCHSEDGAMNAGANVPSVSRETPIEQLISPDGSHISRVSFSPHGSKIVISATEKGFDAINRSPDEAGEIKPAISFEQNFPGRISALKWLAGDESIVFLARAHGKAPLHLYQTNWKTKITRDLTPFGGRNVNMFLLSKDLKTLLASIDMQSKDQYFLWHVDTTSGAITALGKMPKDDGRAIRPYRMIEVKASPELLENRSPVFYYQRSNFVQPSFPAVRESFVFPTSVLKGQELLAGEIKNNVDQRLLMLDPLPAIDREFDLKFKPWSESERISLLNLWRKVCSRVPGLVLRAGHSGRVRFLRITYMKGEKYEIGGPSRAAAAGNGAVILCNEFFQLSDQLKAAAIIHELVHEADYFRHLSTSPEWISLTNANIIAGRQALSFSKEHGLKALDDPGAQYFGLPSLYAASNPMEALAEWTTPYAFGKNPPEKIKSFIDAKLLDPNCSEEITDGEFRRARQAMIDSNFVDAKNFLLKIIKTDRDFLIAYDYLARAYLGLHENAKALETSNELLVRWNKLHIPPEYSLYGFEFYYQHGALLAATGDYAASQKYLDIAQKMGLDRKRFLDAQKFLQKHKSSSLLPRLSSDKSSSLLPRLSSDKSSSLLPRLSSDKSSSLHRLSSDKSVRLKSRPSKWSQSGN